MAGMQRRISWMMVCATVTLTTRVWADDVTLFAARDTTLYEESPDLSNGLGQYLFTGRNGMRAARRGLLAFEVAGGIPKGAKVTKVVLTLALSRAQDAKTTVNLFRVTGAWGEGTSHGVDTEGDGAPATMGDATWTYRVWPTVPWIHPGGDFEPTVSASTDVLSLGTYTWSSEQLTNDVQSFLDQPESNYGWILVADQVPGAAAKRFDSHDNVAGSGPQLLVSYDPPAVATGACCLVDGSCGMSLDPGGTCEGTYLGSGTTCHPGACPEITGACCTADVTAACEIKKKSECLPDAWQGGFSKCDPNPCPVVMTPYVDALPVPVVATPTEGAVGDVASYELRIAQTRQQLHRDLPPTTVWGFDDGRGAGYPGPTIEAGSGAPVRVTWINDLRDESGALLTQHALAVDHCIHGALTDAPRTVVHLHGGHVPARFDGNPEQTLLPGERATYEYPNQQRAATIWYHDHALGITRLNVIMGLAGFYLIRDDEEKALGLPSGKYEIPLVIQDRTFGPDGSFRYPAKWQESFFGNAALVNGKVNPFLMVDRGKYRFRVLNGSTSRTYSLSRSDDEPIMQIGNDGGLLSESFVRQHVTIAPGERADIVIDFEYAPGEVILENDARSPFPNGGAGPDLPEIMKFVVTGEKGHTAPIPLKLATVPELSEAQSAMTRDFVLQKSPADHCGGDMWTINGAGWGDITERPHLGTSEVWRFINRSGVMHPMHIHSLFFQVLDRQSFKLNGEEMVMQATPTRPERGDRGWKDTVQVGPLEQVRVIARFEDFAGRYPYHCHLLEHEDHGMMRQFEAVAVCGDGALARGIEECDDGNVQSGDGCSATCTIERASPELNAAGGGCGCRLAHRTGGAGGIAVLLGASWVVRNRIRRRRWGKM
jgi:spore coat protein A